MRDTIEQFMWPFQHVFRVTVEREVRETFKQVGFGLGARAFLVGFTTDPEQLHPVCFESELDPFANVDLTHVQAEAETRYRSSRDANTIITSGRHHERFHRGLLDTKRADAVRDALAASPQGVDLTFFVARSARIGAYEIHPIVAVPTARWSCKPTLSKTTIDHYSVTPSFQHALMEEVLIAILNALRNIDPPEMFTPHWAGRSEIIRKAAQRFTESVAVYSGYEFASDIAVALDEISAQPYEGRTGNGALLLASPTNSNIDPILRFTQAIPLSQTRSMRKALEMTTGDLHLLCDGEKVHGLAKLRNTYSLTDENAFTFTITARGSWELTHFNDTLLRVENTRPAFPKAPIDADQFMSIVRRVFSHPPANAEALWALAKEASSASHGTMLVVHDDAHNEAARLVPQAQQVAPRPLDNELLSAITNIDGAVLVDPSGICHAIGVILDGPASELGDSSRGARYNSGLRYHQAHKGRCVVIIVSEDGMIDVLPNLRRQVSQASIDSIVSNVEAAATKHSGDGVFNRHWRHLEANAFYLTAGQCERANAARETMEALRKGAAEQRRSDDNLGRITNVGWPPLTPDPDMNDSYYLEITD